MQRRLEKSHDNVVGYSLGGDVADEEYQQVLSELRDDIARHGKIRVLFRLQDLSMQSLFGALGDRYQFFQEHGSDVERIAIVSDDTAGDWLSRLADAAGPADTRRFSGAEEQEAWAWLE